MARRTENEVERCPYVSELQHMIGSEWKIEILHCIGLEKASRFEQIRRCIGEIDESTLSQQLEELTDDGFLERIDYEEVPPRVEYRLAPRGASFVPLLEGMRDWARSELGEPTTVPANSEHPPADLVVRAGRKEDAAAARLLAERLGTPFDQEPPAKDDDRLALLLDADGLSLVGGDLNMQGDLTRMIPRLKPGNLHRELLVKAAKIKRTDGERPTVIDATAGLGDDALLLAAAGFSVQLFERNPVIVALLQDALRRAADVPELADAVSRMHLVEADSLNALRQLPTPPDVIVLDPMFPARTKSAAVKKKFQLLQRIECPCPDEDELLRAAIEAHPRKVVIKRPLKGPNLAGVKPSYSLSGKAIRYDCIVLP